MVSTQRYLNKLSNFWVMLEAFCAKRNVKALQKPDIA